MASDILKVRVEIITYGGRTFDVAFPVTNDQEMLVTYPSTERLLGYKSDSVRDKLASKSLKAFLGEGFTVGKKKGLIINDPGLIGATAKVNLIEYSTLLALAVWEATVNQNAEVAHMLAVGFGDSFRSIAYEQLGMRLSIEDRNEWIQIRNESKSLFWELGKQIEDWLTRTAHSQADWIYYANAHDRINTKLFGMMSKAIKAELGLGKNALARDHYGKVALRRITMVQESASFAMAEDFGLRPTDAIDSVVQGMRLPRCHYLD